MQRVEFEVEPQEDHTFEVEPHGNVDHVASSQEVQTQNLIYYHLTRDREQHSKHELFNYREDNNEVAFAVAKVEKIYAHESLTFNNTVAIEVIFKWKAGLKDDMDAPSDVYVLSNGCKKCNDDSDATKGLLDKAKGNVLGMEIVRDQSGNTLRVSQSRFYNEKLVQTLLEGHSILSLLLEGSLSRDCDVKNNGSLEAMMLHMMALSPTETGYMTLTDAVNEVIWINGLLTESRAKLMSAAIFFYWCLVKGDPYSEVLAMVEVAMYCRRLI
nr:zinc finger, CCHC-type [Tanacetum cinerariifolium]